MMGKEEIPFFRGRRINSDEYITGHYKVGNTNLHKHEKCKGTNTEFIYDGENSGMIICYDCEELGEQYNKDENLNTFHSIFHKKSHYLSRLDGELGSYEIDPTTLAIHFPNNDMLDSEKTPIFASLDKEKGKGGDICIYNDYPAKYTMIFNAKIGVKAINLLNQDDNGYILNPRLTVIGIQK